ncbi:MAG TPA: MBL fold metallo-hydrolase, partial [Verrucomicrobiae bacterium]|nr:MBL fold metallo-hydrolase [Verrucomicrobiae bacterium]
LIDVGHSNSVQFVTKPFLRAQGVNGSPPLVLTHGDLQHMGGAEPFCDEFKVSRIYTSPVRFRSAPYRRILARLAGIPGLLNTVGRDDVVGGWTVLHPNRDDRFTRADDGAIVLRATLGHTRVLLLSDLGRAGQKALLERTPDLRADIVVSGLPAADEPLSEDLLKAIQPLFVIISDSEFPISGRASPRLQARLRRTGLPVLYTRTSGAVTLEFHRHYWQLRMVNGIEFSNTQPNLKAAIEGLSNKDSPPLPRGFSGPDFDNNPSSTAEEQIPSKSPDSDEP